ncbi:Tyrosine recombinase XerC [Nocardia otitidiscaviarum]|uniref:Tyrosine recombinase XerC n=1 Tax=Nocardia otitidiscaviarum TaxID=1823 RepID=A0A378YAV2_9NOCA|nr:site-specific integrase [Nocardia otitidiscaviarum]SUA73670.1 Tyrosine recombinase XerC [Nocardia otitidiscaviarum]
MRRVPSKLHGTGKRWRARYVDDGGHEHTKRFARKTDAQSWLNTQTAALVAGTHIPPRDAQKTVGQWCDEWLEGYAQHRDNTVQLAKWHVKKIKEEFGDLKLSALRPSAVKAWTAKLKTSGLADSYVYSLHSRLSQILGDAVHDNLLARNPCSRRTSPSAGQQKIYVATVEQIWALHDAMPEHLRVAILLGAFVGLRISEAAALRVEDVDLEHGMVYPQRQWPDRPLKTRASDTPVPIPQELADMLKASVNGRTGMHVVSDELAKPVSPWVIGWHLRTVRADIPGLPEGFSFQDLRHFYASLLIRQGADIKTVQARVRHGSAVTTLRYYAHLWPDADATTRTAVATVLRERPRPSAYLLRTESENSGTDVPNPPEN